MEGTGIEISEPKDACKPHRRDRREERRWAHIELTEGDRDMSSVKRLWRYIVERPLV